ncbi:hypothetical protein QQ045_023239 [Rhodiola kirilowii]
MDSHRPSSSQRPSQAILHPNMDADDIIHPGPIDDSVLREQNTHRTEAIWKSEKDTKGKANIPLKIYKGGALPIDHRIRHYVVAVGFYPWTQVCDVKVDPSLLIAVVERWRPETHTFHFNEGEATITLQDVSLLTGLLVDGEHVTGKSQMNFEEVCVRLLGVYPECYDRAPDEETLKKYAWAYLLNLIGSTLFSDKSGKTIPLYFLPLLEDLDRVRNYIWGSDVLACLYSNMCGACTIGHSHLAGVPLIIQFWSWDRLSRIGVPKITVPVVMPLADAEFEPALRGSWSYFSDQSHEMDRKKNRDWAVFHASYIALWFSRHERVIDGDMGDSYASIDEPTPQYNTCMDDYSRMGFHNLFHHLYKEVGKLTDPAIVGVDPHTITLDMADLDIGVDEDFDTHVEDATVTDLLALHSQ